MSIRSPTAEIVIQVGADGLLDVATSEQWNYWACTYSFPPSFIYITHLIITSSGSISTHAVKAKDVYIEVGQCANRWDSNNTILQSSNYGDSSQASHSPSMSRRRPLKQRSSLPRCPLGLRSLAFRRLRPHLVSGHLVQCRRLVLRELADATEYKDEPPNLPWATCDTIGPKATAGTSHIFVAITRGREGRYLRLGGCGCHLGSHPWSAGHMLLVSSLFAVRLNG
jgi:hypothetical protein